MAEDQRERIEITEEEVAQEPPAPSPPARLVIEAADLPTDEELAAPKVYPGFAGGAPVAGLHVVAHCASRKGEYVLGLSERKEGGYWLRVAPGKSTAGVGRGLTVQGPFAYPPDFACPQCGARNIIVCECGALLCHGEKKTTTCPVCQRHIRLAGLASQVEAYGGGKGGKAG